MDPQPAEEEISYLLDHVRQYFSLPFSRGDVVASWSGIRLYKGFGHAATSDLPRSHHIERSVSGLYSIVEEVDRLSSDGTGIARPHRQRRCAQGWS